MSTGISFTEGERHRRHSRGCRLTGRKVHAPDKTLLVVDHNVPPPPDRSKPNPDPGKKARRADRLSGRETPSCLALSIFDEFDKGGRAFVHIIGPGTGLYVCRAPRSCAATAIRLTHGGGSGHSPTAIGTSESRARARDPRRFFYQKKKSKKHARRVIDGKLPHGVTAKDIILAIIGRESALRAAPATQIEYAGEAISALSMEGPQ